MNQYGKVMQKNTDIPYLYVKEAVMYVTDKGK